MDLKQRIEAFSKNVTYMRVRYDTELKHRESVQKELEELHKEMEKLQEASLLIIEATHMTQSLLEIKVNTIIDLALESVLGDESYKFSISFGSRGKISKTSQMSFVLEKKGVILEESLMDSVGGGVISLCALALRTAVLLISNQNRKTIIMDEPLTQLRGNKYEEKACQLIKTLSERFEVQFVIITHEEIFKDYADIIKEI